MDRQKANLPQSQVGFLGEQTMIDKSAVRPLSLLITHIRYEMLFIVHSDFLVIPMFTIWCKFLELDESSCPLMSQLKSNKEHWKNQLEQLQQGATATTGTTTVTNPTPTNTATLLDRRTSDTTPIHPPNTIAPISPTPSAASVNETSPTSLMEMKENIGDGSNKVAPAP